MNLRATKNRIIVKPDPAPERDGRFFVKNLIPSAQGKVVSVGPELRDEIKPGQSISWRPFQGTELDYQGVTYKVIQPEDVMLLLSGVDSVSVPP